MSVISPHLQTPNPFPISSSEGSVSASNSIFSSLSGICSSVGTFITGANKQTALKVAAFTTIGLPILHDLMTSSYSREESPFANSTDYNHVPLVSHVISGTFSLDLLTACVKNIALASFGIITASTTWATLSDPVITTGNLHFSSISSSLTPTTTTLSEKSISLIADVSMCATGLLALITGQPLIQFAGSPLLTRCLNIPGVRGDRVDITFVTTAGGNGSSNGYAAQETAEGVMVVGWIDAIGAGGKDVLFTEFAENGTLSSVYTIGGSGDEQCVSTKQTRDNGSILACHTNSIGAGLNDFLVIKLTAERVVEWAKTFGGMFDDYAYIAKETNAGNFIAAGTTYSFGAVNGKILFLQLTKNGTLSCSVMLDGINLDQVVDLEEIQDGEYALTFDTTSFGGRHAAVLTINSNCTVSLAKILSSNFSYTGKFGQKTSDGGYQLGGHITGPSSLGLDGVLLRLTPTLTLLWGKAIRGIDHDSITALQQIEDANFAVTGWTKSFGCCPGLTSNIFIAEFDGNGNVSSAKIFTEGNATVYAQGSFIQRTKDRGWSVGGSTNIIGTTNYNIFLAKLDSHYRIHNCNATEFINLPIQDITNLINISNISFNLTYPSLIQSNWAVSAVKQTLNQNMTCRGDTITRTITKSVSPSEKSMQSRSSSGSLEKTQSLSPSVKFSLSSTKSLFHSQSASLLQTQSLLHSNSRSLKGTETFSKQKIKTKTLEPTPTEPPQLNEAVLIKKYNLTLPGIIHTLLAASGSIVLIETNTGLQFITIDQDDTMTPTGLLAISGKVQATTFSKDEQYVFLADNQGNIQVINIQNPYNPQLAGVIPTGIPIQSLAISGRGNDLLVGTNTGITVLSVKTPASVNSITQITSYPTSNPVTSIQSNPNTDLIAIGTGNMMRLLNFKNESFTQLGQTTFTEPVKTIAPVDQTDPGQLALKLANGNTIVMNITNPTSAIVTSTIPGSLTALAALSGSTLLVSGLKPGIQIFQSEEDHWSTAKEAGYSPVVGPVTSLLFASNGKFGIYSDTEGLKLIKIITAPGRLDIPLTRLLSVVKMGFPIQDVLLNEEKNWIALAGNQLVFIKKNNLQHPQVLGFINTTESVRQIIFFPDKNTMLFTDYKTIGCINCFNPEIPVLLGLWNNAKNLYGMTLKGSHLYVCQGSAGIAVVDVTNPFGMLEIANLPTQGSAQSIRFNQALSRAYVADGSGIDIWSMNDPLNPQRISRFNSTGLISLVAPSLDETMLYFANEQTLGQIKISDPSMPTFLNRLDTGRPIKSILLSRKGTVVYVADETNGVLVVEAKTLQIKGKLPTSSANALVLNKHEDEIFVADLEGGLQVAELITEIPIITLTSKSEFSVGIPTKQTLLFFNQDLTAVKINGINAIQYVNNGQKADLPFWISADLTQGNLFVTAPKELTGQSIQLAISLNVEGVIQESFYQAQIVSSLIIDSNKGSVSISTPSPTVSVDVKLSQANFIPQPSGIISASTEGNLLKMFGPIVDINNYLHSVRVVPNPITLNSFDITTNPTEVKAIDIINLLPTNSIVPLGNFLFDQPPFVANPMKQVNIKGLELSDIKVPSNTFTDPDDPILSLTAQLSNGTQLPPGLTFNPKTATFSVYAPVSWLNKTLFITITASDGYFSVNNTWPLYIEANTWPFVEKPIPEQTFPPNAAFTYAIPSGTFQDSDNNTLTYGYDILPDFLKFDREMKTFSGNPSSNDVGSYKIKVTASNKFGASADTTLSLNIKFSDLDYILNVLGAIGIASSIATPFTLMYYYRMSIINIITKKFYWRSKPPENLLEGKSYKPTHLRTGKIIKKEEIAKIHFMVINQKKWGHDRLKECLHTHLFISRYAEPLFNNEALPSWIELDPNERSFKIKSDLFRQEDDTYLYQAIGKNGRILDGFLISRADLSLYQPPQDPLQTDQDQGSTIVDVWNGIDLPIDVFDEFELELINQRPGDETQPRIINESNNNDLEALLNQGTGDITQPGIINESNNNDLEALLDQGTGDLTESGIIDGLNNIDLAVHLNQRPSDKSKQ